MAGQATANREQTVRPIAGTTTTPEGGTRSTEPATSAGRLCGHDHAAGELPRVLRNFFQQFGHPRGLVGRLAGRIMARRNADLNRWVVDLLDLDATDRVLDAGCGPGLAVALVAAAQPAFVAGVDVSTVMVRQALRRNRAVVRAGRAEVRLATVLDLPYARGEFTKACSVNSLQHWPSVEGGLGQLRRVLADDGVLVLALRMRRAGASRYDRSAYGLTEEHIVQVSATLQSLGFSRRHDRAEGDRRGDDHGDDCIGTPRLIRRGC